MVMPARKEAVVSEPATLWGVLVRGRWGTGRGECT
jgi:hypothetical protein